MAAAVLSLVLQGNGSLPRLQTGPGGGRDLHSGRVGHPGGRGE